MTDDKNGKIEVVTGLTDMEGFKVVPGPPSWQEEVWDRTDGRCYGCGSDHKNRVKLIVPLEAGGTACAENACLICRGCEMATDASKPKNKTINNRPINFWVSRRLFQRMDNGLCSNKGFNSKSALIRYLMSKYIQEDVQFDDLEQYQDAAGTDSARINAWVPVDTYETFKAMLDKRGMTVTEAVIALVMVYEMETTARKDEGNE
jgi:hypothetical protein